MGALRFGTSSWSEKSWVGPFYPEGTPAGDFLGYYSTVFDTVEADVTYYRVPDARMVANWERVLPRGFRLAAKFPREVVHAGRGEKPDGSRMLGDEAWPTAELFLERMSLLGTKCGPLLLQFPYLNRSAFAERGPFLGRLERFLARLPGTFRYAVELRNKSWIDAELLDFLRERNVALVWVDLAYMPHPDEFAGKLDLVSADFAYARLIGDRKQIDALTKTFDHIVLDRGERLARWADFLVREHERVPETYVYANNHFAGHGPATVRELAALVEARGS